MLVGQYPYHLSNTYIGSLAQEHRLNITSNNLANVNTPGFKKDVPVFDGYLVAATKTYFAHGSFQQTKAKLDLALSGPGFFQVETPNGVRYTRNGSFNLNAEGQIVTKEGYPVVGAGAIPANAKEVTITEDGRVLVDGGQAGQIDLVEFEDPNVLAKAGNNLFVPKVEGLAGGPANNTTVNQGYLETSNVDPVMESVNMIDTMRTYEVFQAVIQSFQEADQKSINEVGRMV